MKLIVNSLIKLGILKKDLDYHLIRISRRLRGFCITKILPPDANQNSIRNTVERNQGNTERRMRCNIKVTTSLLITT